MFRYEASWDFEEEHSLKIAQLWNSGLSNNNPLTRVQQSLKACQEGLKNGEHWKIETKMKL